VELRQNPLFKRDIKIWLSKSSKLFDHLLISPGIAFCGHHRTSIPQPSTPVKLTAGWSSGSPRFSIWKKLAWDETKVHLQSLSVPGEQNLSLEHTAEIFAAVLMVAALPLLDFIGPPYARFLQRRRNAERSRKATLPAVSAGTVAE
jgi:hypothetical protein